MLLSYRIFSVISIALLGILGYTHIRKDFGEKAGAIFSLLTYTLPANIVYASEIRMYGWAMLFVYVLFLFFLICLSFFSHSFFLYILTINFIHLFYVL